MLSLKTSDEFSFDNDIIEKEIQNYTKNWSVKDWWWRPNKLIVRSLEQLVYLKSPEILNSITEIKVWEDTRSSHRRLIIGVLIDFVKIYQHIKVDHGLIDIINGEETSSIRIQTNSLIFIKKSAIIPVIISKTEVEIKSDIIKIIDIDEKEWILVEYKGIKADHLVVQYDSKLKQIIESSELKSKINSKNTNSIYILVKVQDVKSVGLWFWRSPAVGLFINNPKSIKIDETNEIKWMKLLIKTLKIIPRKIKVELKLFFNSTNPYLMEEFWKTVLEFKDIIFLCKENKPIKIAEAIGELNINDLKKNNFKVIIDGSEEILSFKVLCMLLQNIIFHL